MGLFPFRNHVIAKERKSAEPLCRRRRPLGQRAPRPERAEEVEEAGEEPSSDQTHSLILIIQPFSLWIAWGYCETQGF